MKLIIGLGNPGKAYENTRHNIGFIVLDQYLNNENWKTKFQALYCDKVINGEKVIFVKPQTFMNLSGNSIIEFINFYKVNNKDILVIHDDLDLPLGTYRIKTNSSAGGHNGITSIINYIGKDFARLKIGISNNKNIDTKDYVLGKFSKEELSQLIELQPVFAAIINDFFTNDINKLMNKYNGVK